MAELRLLDVDFASLAADIQERRGRGALLEGDMAVGAGRAGVKNKYGALSAALPFQRQWAAACQQQAGKARAIKELRSVCVCVCVPRCVCVFVCVCLPLCYLRREQSGKRHNIYAITRAACFCALVGIFTKRCVFFVLLPLSLNQHYVISAIPPSLAPRA